MILFGQKRSAIWRPQRRIAGSVMFGDGSRYGWTDEARVVCFFALAAFYLGVSLRWERRPACRRHSIFAAAPPPSFAKSGTPLGGTGWGNTSGNLRRTSGFAGG
jgi:hypothetical protein